MDRETLKQWMSEAGLSVREDPDGFLNVSRGTLEISIGYISEVDMVVCFTPILELAGLEDSQRMDVLSRSLSLNGVGNLPAGCALAFEDTAEVVYLLWQHTPEQLDSARFANAFRDFETSATQVQEHLQSLLGGATGTPGDLRAQDFRIKV